MKNLFLLFVIAMIHGCGCVAFAQLTPNTQRYFEYLPTSVNLIKNPSARLNKNNVTATGTVTVTNVAASGNNPSYFTLGAISTLGYAEFALNPVKSKDTSGSCEFKGQYFGTEASKYSARIFNNTTEILKVTLKNTTSDLPGGGPWGEFSVGAPCSSTPKVRIYADAVGLVLNVTNLYYDKATNIGTYTPPSDFGAFVTAAGAISLVTPVGSNILPGSATVSDTSLFTMALTGLTSTPKCWASVNLGTSTVTPSAFVSSVTNTSVSVRTGTVPVGANPSLTKAAVDFTLNCLKTGADAPVAVVRADQQQLPKTITYTSGSGTYTPTPGTVYITVEMVGGGGGGGGSGSGGGTGGAGGNTTLGSSVLTARGGAAGAFNDGGGLGGTTTVSAPAVSILDSQGGTGGSSEQGRAYGFGGIGGANQISGVSGPVANLPSQPGKIGGGGGGGGSAGTPVVSGSGGGAGGYIRAKIDNPSPMPYTVGAKGTFGVAGTSGFPGAAGGDGIIIITEYFSPFGAMIIPGMEPIGASYHSPTNTTVANNTNHPIFFGTKIWEYGNSYNVANGEFTVPVGGDGMYQATCDIAYTSGSWTLAQEASSAIQVDGVTVTVKSIFSQVTASYPVMVPSSILIQPLTAGQKVRCIAYQNSGSSKTLYTSSIHKFTIVRTGLK